MDLETSLVSEILCFLEAAIHSILRIRNIYPAHLFKSVQKFGISCYQSRHPELNDYIHNMLHSSTSFFKTGSLEKFILGIKCELTGDTLEEYCFTFKKIGSFSDYITMEEAIMSRKSDSKNKRKFGERSTNPKRTFEESLAEVKMHLRRMLIQVLRSDNRPSLENSCTFAMQIVTCELADDCYSKVLDDRSKRNNKNLNDNLDHFKFKQLNSNSVALGRRSGNNNNNKFVPGRGWGEVPTSKFHHKSLHIPLSTIQIDSLLCLHLNIHTPKETSL